MPDPCCLSLPAAQLAATCRRLARCCRVCAGRQPGRCCGCHSSSAVGHQLFRRACALHSCPHARQHHRCGGQCELWLSQPTRAELILVECHVGCLSLNSLIMLACHFHLHASPVAGFLLRACVMLICLIMDAWRCTSTAGTLVLFCAPAASHNLSDQVSPMHVHT